jgi:flagellar basal-body rod protein FlgG
LVDNFIINKLQIQDFHQDSVVQKGNNLLYPKDNIMLYKDANAHIRQGYLESSNVNIVKEMIKMIAINRQYQANEKAIRTNDEALNKSVNNIAR